MSKRLNRSDRILRHALYRECLKKITEAEKTRIFCKHDKKHNRAVANLMLQYAGEQGAEDIILATAYLHDIGRCREYESGWDHAAASAELAEQILADCGYDDAERRMICEAICGHRGHEAAKKDTEDAGAEMLLANWLKLADKKSRPCYRCKASVACYWPEEKKNKKTGMGQ